MTVRGELEERVGRLEQQVEVLLRNVTIMPGTRPPAGEPPAPIPLCPDCGAPEGVHFDNCQTAGRNQ